MSTLLRDAFVAMHSDNIVGRLSEEFQTRYKGCMYLASVLIRSRVGQKIREVRYHLDKAGLGKNSELALEAERMRLVESNDPEEREKGEAMVTPGSVFTQDWDESAFALPSELVDQSLGVVPEGPDDQEASNVEEAEPTAEGVLSGSATDLDTDALAESISTIADPEEKATVVPSPPNKGKTQKQETKIHVWLPLKFPDVPPKGDFDVTRLRQSKYFFH